MFLKLVLLFAYLVVLFMLTRILETLTWIEMGNLSRKLLDPMTMSVMKLKALLDQRGISYEGAIEKQDLADLVESSGAVTEDAESTFDEEDASGSVTNFTAGSLFDEHVEDAKDSVWLVYIIPDHSHLNYLADTSWNIIKHKMSKFGVNTGVFDCSLDPMYCAKRDWHYSCLILGLPEDFRSKSKVTLYKYTGPFKVSSIHGWIKDSISNKVATIDSMNTYINQWKTYKDDMDQSEVRVVMFSQQPSIPLFFSAVSVKFPGRAKFGFVNMETNSIKDIGDSTVKTTTYIVITHEYVTIYGHNIGEDLTFRSMEMFLKSLYPCVNDMFVLSLIVCNCLTVFELSLTHGSFIKRLMRFIWCIVKFNMCLLLIWISLLTLLQLPLMHNFTSMSLKLLRVCRLSTLGNYIFKDFCFYSRHIVLTEMLFSLYLVSLAYLCHRFNGPEDQDSETEDDEWNFSQFRTLEHLFSPTAGLFRTAGIPAIDPERVRIRDIPTLQQVCKVPDDYINTLPKWQFKFDKEKKCHANDPSNINDQENNYECSSKDDDTGPCQECQKCQKPGDSCKKLPEYCKKHMGYLDRLKQMDGTDQSDTDQEKDECHMIDDYHSYLENSQCVICLEDYGIGVWLCGLPCGHSFHQTCINTWLSRDNHYCPVCRWSSYTPKPSSLHLHSE